MRIIFRRLAFTLLRRCTHMEFKQCIVVRTDLKMGRGKTCAQVAHASLGAAEVAMRRAEEWYREWKRAGEKKVVLRGESLRQLQEVYARASAMGLPCFIVRDAGLTQLPPGTVTAVAVGPAPAEQVDRITGELRLL